MHRVLAIDDDIQLGEYIREKLTAEGMECTTRYNAETGMYALKGQVFDIIILDVMMKGINGIDTAIAIRKMYPQIPVIFLSSQTNLQIRLEGLRSGADDYMTKPFSISELVLRINNILRRVNPSSFPAEDKVYEVGAYSFDAKERKLALGNKTVMLSNKEASLLNILCSNKNMYVQRDRILAQIWNRQDQYATNSMDVYVSRLRKLLKDDPSISIENLHGTGFRIVCS